MPFVVRESAVAWSRSAMIYRDSDDGHLIAYRPRVLRVCVFLVQLRCRLLFEKVQDVCVCGKNTFAKSKPLVYKSRWD